MNLLLDTHVLLWWLADEPLLGEEAREAIGNGANIAYVSAASVWEIRIKQAIGKLQLPPDFREVLQAQPFLPLDITVEHAHAVAALPMHHRDPFDRILVAQAARERLTLVTSDPRFKPYGIATLRA